MNASELANKMLQWEVQKKKLNILEFEIKDAVLDLRKTQTVGDVRATYSKGRAKYDYETPGSQAEEEIIGLYSKGREFVNWEGLARSYDPSDTVITSFTEFETIIDWRQVCKDADIEPLILSQGEPSVKLKLLE